MAQLKTQQTKPDATEPLTPLETLFDASSGASLPLPAALAELYGRLSFSTRPAEPTIFGNFVSTLDGVVSLSIPGRTGGGEISGFNQHDRMVMGLLRAVADAVIVGAGTVRDVGRHLWTAAFAYPKLAGAYAELRAALGKTGHPLNVFVTGSGRIDLERLRLAENRVPVLIATTEEGAKALGSQPLPEGVEVAPLAKRGPLSVRTILATVAERRDCRLLLTEGGPRLLADFLAEGALDELFLTVAPQMAGRDLSHETVGERPGLAMGRHFAPDLPQWSRLVSAKRAESHLFLRYQFSRPGSAEAGEG